MSTGYRKMLALAILLVTFAATSTAQNSGCIPLQVIAPPTPTGTGQPVINAPFRVCTSTATGVPCSPIYTPLYYDPALSNPQPNPSSTDGNGNLNFCAAPGNYLVQVTVSLLPPVTYSIYATVNENASQVVLLNPAGTQTITQSGGPLAIVGNMTVSGTLGVTGNTTIGGTLGVTGAITATGGVVGALTGTASNASQLLNATWASPPAAGYGSTTPRPIAATTLSTTSLATINSMVLGGSQTVTGVQGTTGANFAVCTGSLTSGNLRSTDANGNCIDSAIPAANVQPTIVIKKGTGSSTPYSTSSTSFTDVDATNLAYTVTIPTGWKLLVDAAASMFQSTGTAAVYLGIYDGSVVVSTAIAPAALPGTSAASLTWAITGDGNPHTVKLQFATSNTSDAANIQNTSANGFVPVMRFQLMWAK